MKIAEIEKELKNVLSSEFSSGYITKEEMETELAIFHNWSSSAEIGDTYNYYIYEFVYDPEYD